jgi:hypothetical protein
LDIENFVPDPESIRTRLAKNTGLHMTLVVLVVLSLGIFIYLSQKEQLDAQLARVLNHDTVVEPSASETSAITSPPESPAGSITDSPTAKALATTVPATDPAPAVDKKTSRELVITFAEVSKSVLQQLVSEGQILNETAQSRSALINLENPARLADRDPEFNLLPGGASDPLRVGAPNSLNFTHMNANNEDVGLDLSIHTVQASDTNIEIDLAGNLLLKSEAGLTLTNQGINANYSFSTKSTLVIIGLLPRETIKQEDLNQFDSGPLSIYQSTAFLNGLTEFAIFVQVR